MKSTLKQNKKKNFNKTSLKHRTKFQLIFLLLDYVTKKKKKEKDRVICILYTYVYRLKTKTPTPWVYNPTNKLYNVDGKEKKGCEEVVTKRSESNMNNWLLELYGLTTKMMKI